MKKSLFALIATLALMAQPSSATETVPAYYEEAYTLIEDMLLHPEKMDFKEVVFAVDNAYGNPFKVTTIRRTKQ
ncbi:MAG: hypothetical protein IJU36_07560 [Paludibacteraceae bacterium]|nr:hypothetical protein [Paludibacteraceae bacterium]